MTRGAIDYRMPKLAMAMNEGTINEWLIAHGEYIEAGTPIAVVETEKTAYECEAPVSGYLEILVAADTTVDVETLIGRFHETAENAKNLAPSPGPVMDIETVPESSTPIQSKDRSGQRIISSPAARKLARTQGVDLARITGSGPKGRIVKRDVLALQHATTDASVKEQTGSPVVAPTSVVDIAVSRRTIASRMRESLSETAQVSGHFEADITKLDHLRKSLIEREAALGTRISMNALLIKSICHAIQTVPEVNACVVDNRIERYSQINLGIAVARPDASAGGSLVVAVLHNIGNAGLVEINERTNALVARVRDGSATADDYQGSTISMSSTAGIAPPGLTSTPILNRPNIFMVGISTPLERPVLVNGTVESRKMLPVSYTFDHCAIDGEPTARFLAALNDRLQEPALLLT